MPAFLASGECRHFVAGVLGIAALDESFVRALDLDLIEWLQNVGARASKLD